MVTHKKVLVIAKKETGKEKNDSHHDINESVKKHLGTDVKIVVFRCKNGKLDLNNKMFKKKSKDAFIISSIGSITGLEAQVIRI